MLSNNASLGGQMCAPSLAIFSIVSSLACRFAALHNSRKRWGFRGSGIQGFKPLPEYSVERLEAPIHAGFRGSRPTICQGFRGSPEFCMPASPYPCGFQRFTFSPCSKEHCRVLNPCMHLHIRATPTAVNPYPVANTSGCGPPRFRQRHPYPTAVQLPTTETQSNLYLE
jgi:hypothetical protein